MGHKKRSSSMLRMTFLSKYISSRLHLGCEVEADILEVLLGQGQGVARVGQEDIAAMFIDGHVGVFATLEVFQLLLVVALDPARLVY